MLKDFVIEQTNSPGTATTINLAGALTDRVAFASVFANGSPVFYFLDDGTQAEWGAGVFNAGSPNTLTRSTVLGNTSGTLARLNFLSTTRVYNELPSARALYVDNSNIAKLPAGGRLDTLAGGMPIGAGMLWYATTAPTGWLPCNGSWVSRTAYSALFSVIGTTFGAADGASYFALPDLRGRVPVGLDVDNGGGLSNRISGVISSFLGNAGGDQWLQGHNHTVTINDNYHTHSVYDPGHAHAVSDPGHTHGYYDNDMNRGGAGLAAGLNNASGDTGRNTLAAGTGIAIYGAGTGISLYAQWAGITSGSIGVSGAGGQQNVQPSLIVNYIIFAGV